MLDFFVILAEFLAITEFLAGYHDYAGKSIDKTMNSIRHYGKRAGNGAD